MTVLLPLAACQSVDNGASYLSGHMPVIDDRCEYWQCFTESGRAQSELNRQARLAREQADTTPPPAEPVATVHPINSAAP